MSAASVFWKIAEAKAAQLDKELATLRDENTRLRVEVERLKEEVAFRLDQAREAIASRDTYRSQAERKRLLAREFEEVLGFTEDEARQEGAIEEAVKRIKALKANQCEEKPLAWATGKSFTVYGYEGPFHDVPTAIYDIPLYRKARP